MSVGLEAFLWGLASAISLPLGALLGILWQPKSKINSAFMAFGAGALLFALSVELFGHVPHHAKNHGYYALLAALIGALIGGALFDLLNKALNNKGAFLRSLSNAKKYVARIKVQRAQAVVEELSSIKVLHGLSPEQMAGFVQRMRKISVPANTRIFNQGDDADKMFFLIKGEVQILRKNGGGSECEIATLADGETFGEMGILTEQGRSASAVTKINSYFYTLDKSDFSFCIAETPELQKQLNKLASQRIDDLSIKDAHFDGSRWRAEAISHIEMSNMPVSDDEIRLEGEVHGGANNAAFAIWLGILIDAIPESLVIGMLAMSSKGMSLAFVAGVFLANLPEAMSSSVSMKKSGMNVKKILWMWGTLALLTGIGAYMGTVFFPADPQGATFYFVIGIEGLAGGAMLTMIAETMLPEAFEQGGSIVGLATLLGFLSALCVAVI